VFSRVFSALWFLGFWDSGTPDEKGVGVRLTIPCCMFQPTCKHASIQTTTESRTYHPRVEEALTLTKVPDVVRARFEAAYTAGLAKMQQYIDNLARAVKFYRCLRVFDPRNIRDMEAPWSSVSDLLGMEPR
jgi:hypothetical protein